jgi:P27 family predicted phage terminase small subunit
MSLAFVRRSKSAGRLTWQSSRTSSNRKRASKVPMPRKSLSEHDLTGTKPQYVLPDADVPAGRPRYPKGISADAKRFFKGICKMLEKRRTLTEGDAELIRLAAVLRTRHEKAIEHVTAEGEICSYTRLDKKGETFESVAPNVWLKIAQESEKQLVTILDRLGLTPASRGKITPAEPPKTSKTNSEDEALLSREATQPVAEEPEIDIYSIDTSAIN